MLQQPTPTPQTITGIFSNLQESVVAAVPRLITASLVFAIFLVIAQVGQRVIAYTAPRVNADTGVVLLLSRVYFYGVITFGVLTALSTAGLDVSALIAGLGLTGFALGFALKDVLSNLVSGIMLLIYRPFSIGDQIKMGEFEGTIKAIRMRDTVVRSYDGRSIIIPNTKLITEVVVNNHSAPLLRESVQLKVERDSDAHVAREVFLRSMISHTKTKGRVEPRVTVGKLDGGAAQLEGHFWYDPRETDRTSIRRDVEDSVKKSLDEAGIRASVLPPAKAAVRPEPTAEEINALNTDDAAAQRAVTHDGQ